MRKTILYILLLGALAYGVYYFLFAKRENGFAVSEAGFTIKDTAAIGRIFINGQGGKSVLVERTDSGWIVDKKYKVLRAPLNGLLKVLYQQTALYPVPQGMHNTIVSSLAGNAIKVELDNRRGERMRVFYVGGETKDFGGTYMLMEGAKRPYVVNMPGFQGYLAPFYSFSLSDWRDRNIFDLKPAQIKSVSVQYPEHPINSFVLKHEKENPEVEADPEIVKMGALNLRRANVFLKFFENVNCEGYITHYGEADSILKTTPKYCSIELTGKQGQYQHLDIYWMPLNRRSKNLSAPVSDVPDNKYDADRFYAVMNNYKDTIMIQRSVFGKIFRSAYEFYQADETEPMKILPESKKK